MNETEGFSICTNIFFSFLGAHFNLSFIMICINEHISAILDLSLTVFERLLLFDIKKFY